MRERYDLIYGAHLLVAEGAKEAALAVGRVHAGDVEVLQPGSILRGRGLSADLNAKTFELKADVHGQFAPKR